MVGLANIDHFKPLGRSDVELKKLLGNPLVSEFNNYQKFDESWIYNKYHIVLSMKNHHCIAASPFSNVFH